MEAQAPTDENSSRRCYEEIAEIKAREIQLSSRLREIEPSCEQVILSEEDIAAVIEIWTGVPATEITENEFCKIDKLEERMKKKIIGQDSAADAVAKAIRRKRAGEVYARSVPSRYHGE